MAVHSEKLTNNGIKTHTSTSL